MKKICVKSIVACLLGTLATTFCVSCADMLDEKGFSFVNDKNIENNDEGAQQWATGAFSVLTYEVFRWNAFPHVLDFDCDYMTGPDWAFGKFGSGNFQDDDHAQQMWEKMYNMIHRCNLGIENVEAMTGTTPRGKDNAIGEMQVLRSYAYFLLVRAFGPIPIRDHTINSGLSDIHQPRQPIDSVYHYIIANLQQAEQRLYKNTDREFSLGHVSAGTAASLLAKVYLTMASGAVPTGEKVIVRGGKAFEKVAGEKVYTNPVAIEHQKTQLEGYDKIDYMKYFALARDKAKEVIDGKYGSYDLLPYDALWAIGNRNKVEHIWSLQTVSNDDIYGVSFGEGYAGVLGTAGETYGLHHGMRNHWYKLFEPQDYRITKGVMHSWQRYHALDYHGGSYYPNTDEWKKKAQGYTNDEGKWVAPVAPFNDGLSYESKNDNNYLAYLTKYTYVSDRTKKRADIYFPFLRFADVLLIYAEAANEANDGPTSEALNALNRVRVRSNATPKSLTGVGNINDKVLFRSAVLEERAMEFAEEGDRRWDLIRWGIYLPVMNAIGGTDEVDIVKSRMEKHLLFPIPGSEVGVNKFITTNNPGW